MRYLRKRIRELELYGFLGLLAFGLSLVFAFVLEKYFSIYYLWAVSLAFFLATSINYLLDERLIFAKSHVPIGQSYIHWILIEIAALAIIVGVTFFGTEVLGLYFLIARVLGGITSVMLAYFLEARFAFRVL